MLGSQHAPGTGERGQVSEGGAVMSPDVLNAAPPTRSYKLVSVEIRSGARTEDGEDGVTGPCEGWASLPWFGSSEPAGERMLISILVPERSVPNGCLDMF